MSNEMIERVEKAVKETEDAWLLQAGDALDGLQEEPEFPLYVTIARAAIEAMREPTQEMTAVVCNVGETRSKLTIIFRAMINAALEES